MEIVLPAGVSLFQVDGLVNGKDNIQSTIYAKDENEATEQYTKQWGKKYNGIKVMAVTKIG